ncbi:MAG: amidohydrolase family protein [Burkholderiaceae bacterium]
MRAIDAHAHVLDPERFAYVAETPYRPSAQEIGTPEQYLAVLDAHGISHALLVQPTSGYACDNRCMLDAVARYAPRLRAIVRIDCGEPRPDVSVLDNPQVVGLRLDLIGEGDHLMHTPGLPWVLDALRERQQLLQIQCERDQLAAALPQLLAAKLTLIVDHCGRPEPAVGVQQPGFQALLELGREGHYVKLSGAFRFSREPVSLADTRPFVDALIETFTPMHCVWGSDWPYLRLPTRRDYGPALAMFAEWLPDARDRERVLCDVPRKLFRFDQAGP